jgi:hypothetical protein
VSPYFKGKKNNLESFYLFLATSWNSALKFGKFEMLSHPPPPPKTLAKKFDQNLRTTARFLHTWFWFK